MKYVLLLTLLLLSSCSKAGNSRSYYLELEGTPEEPAEVQIDDVKVKSSGKTVLSINTAEQPIPPKSPATSSAGPKGGSADSGEAGDMPITFGGWTFWVGTALLLIGAFLYAGKKFGFVARVASAALPGPAGMLARFVEAIPAGFGLIVMSIGGGFIVLPWIVGELTGWFIPVAGTIVLIYLAKHLYNWRRNEKVAKRERDLPNPREASDATTRVYKNQ